MIVVVLIVTIPLVIILAALIVIMVILVIIIIITAPALCADRPRGRLSSRPTLRPSPPEMIIPEVAELEFDEYESLTNMYTSICVCLNKKRV